MSISSEIKESFKHGSSLTKIIYINLAVFVVYNLIRVIFFIGGAPLGDSVAQYIAVPADTSGLLVKPWTIFTYMFFHEEFLHILFNMLWLYWFGMMFLEYMSQQKLVAVYIMGGITGALVYILAFNFLPIFSNILPMAFALGASASVLAVVIAISTLKPNMSINLMFIGSVKLKYLALFSVLLDVISIPISNPGGHIAHLGGALFGYMYIIIGKQGIDLAKPILWVINYWNRKRSPRSHLKVNYYKGDPDFEYNRKKVEKHASIDQILDKIAKSGYDSLSKEEKETLFKFKDNSVN